MNAGRHDLPDTLSLRGRRTSLRTMDRQRKDFEMSLSAATTRLIGLLLSALLLSTLHVWRPVSAVPQDEAPRLSGPLAAAPLPAASAESSAAGALDPGPIYDGGTIVARRAPPGAVGASAQAALPAAAPQVSKTVSPQIARPGQSVTYTLRVESQDTLSHTIELIDMLPAGVTYVPGSLSGAGATYDAAENTIRVSAELIPTRAANYSYEDSLSVPDLAAYSPLGGFVDFSAAPYNLAPLPRADNSALNFNVQCPFDFYGATDGTANFLGYSTNGLFFPRGIPATSAESSLVTGLPAPAAPNGLIAGFWESMSLTNTNTFTNSGRLPVLFNTSCDQRISVLQLKNLHTRSDSNPARNALDVELVYNHGQPEHYWVLYNNVRGPLMNGVIGLENQSGTLGLEYFNNGVPASHRPVSGRVIHYFRPLLPPPPLQITFQATVDADAPGSITNVARYRIDGAENLESASATVLNPVAPTPIGTSPSGAYLPLLYGPPAPPHPLSAGP